MHTSHAGIVAVKRTTTEAFRDLVNSNPDLAVVSAETPLATSVHGSISGSRTDYPVHSGAAMVFGSSAKGGAVRAAMPASDKFAKMVYSEAMGVQSELKASLTAVEALVGQSELITSRAAAVKHLRISLAKNHSAATLTALQPSFDRIVMPVLASILERYVSNAEAAASKSDAPPMVTRSQKRPRAEPSRAVPQSLSAARCDTTSVAIESNINTSGHNTAGSLLEVPALADIGEEEVFDALWCLINISAGDSHMTRIVLKHGIVALMVRLLKCGPPPEVMENAIWVCGNIAGDGAHGREELLRAQVLEMLVGLVAAELMAIGYYPFIDDASEVSRPGSAPEPEQVVPDTAPDVSRKLHRRAHASFRHSNASSEPDSPSDLTFDTERQEPWYTSKVLRVATWVLLSVCEGQPRPMMQLELLLPVFNACLECPDPEVQSHVCWALSHICDGPPEHIFSLLCNLVCIRKPNVDKALSMLPNCAPGDFCHEAVGVWTPQCYSPSCDAAIAAIAPPLATKSAILECQAKLQSYPGMLAASPSDSASAALALPEDATQQVIVPSTAAKLVSKLRHDSTRVCKPALRALGNIVCAEDERDFTQAVVNLGLAPLLKQLMFHSVREIQKEACWTMSNVAAGTPAQIQAVMDSGCIPRVLIFCVDTSADVGVRTEACWVLLNAISCGSERQIECLVRDGAVRVLCALLSDPSMMMMALDGLEKIMQVGERLSLTAANLVRARGRTPQSIISNRSELPTSFGKKATPPSKKVVKGKGKPKVVDGVSALLQPHPDAAALLQCSPPSKLPWVLPPDILLEEVLLAEAKLLLDTCRTQLLNKHKLLTPLSAPAGAAAGVLPSSSKADAVFKKAEKLWASHFVTCELCQATYSKSSNSTKYCEECRCNVCTACDCNVYHMSYQLELLGDIDAEIKSAHATTAKSKPKSKSGKKPPKKGVMNESGEKFPLESIQHSAALPTPKFAAAASLESPEEDVGSGSDGSALADGALDLVKLKSDDFKPVAVKATKGKPHFYTEPATQRRSSWNNAHSGHSDAFRIAQSSARASGSGMPTAVKLAATPPVPSHSSGTRVKVASTALPTKIETRIEATVVRNPSNPWGKGQKPVVLEHTPIIGDKAEDPRPTVPDISVDPSTRRTWRAVVSGQPSNTSSSSSTPVADDVAAQAHTPIETSPVDRSSREDGQSCDFDGEKLGIDYPQVAAIPGMGAHQLLPPQQAQALLQLAMSMPHLFPQFAMLPQFIAQFGPVPADMDFSAYGMTTNGQSSLSAEDFPPLAASKRTVATSTPPKQHASPDTSTSGDISSTGLPPGLVSASGALLLPGVHLPPVGNASPFSGFQLPASPLPTAFSQHISEMASSHVQSPISLLPMSGGEYNSASGFGGFYGNAGPSLWSGVPRFGPTFTEAAGSYLHGSDGVPSGIIFNSPISAPMVPATASVTRSDRLHSFSLDNSAPESSNLLPLVGAAGLPFGGSLESRLTSTHSYVDEQESGSAVETDQEDHALLSSIARMALLE